MDAPVPSPPNGEFEMPEVDADAPENEVLHPTTIQRLLLNGVADLCFNPCPDKYIYPADIEALLLHIVPPEYRKKGHDTSLQVRVNKRLALYSWSTHMRLERSPVGWLA
jgi:hypothetical protein